MSFILGVCAFILCVYIATNVALICANAANHADISEGAEALRLILVAHCKRDIAHIFLRGGKWYAHLAKGDVLVSDLLKNPLI